jgi:hypothetical protein
VMKTARVQNASLDTEIARDDETLLRSRHLELSDKPHS